MLKFYEYLAVVEENRAFFVGENYYPLSQHLTFDEYLTEQGFWNQAGSGLARGLGTAARVAGDFTKWIFSDDKPANQNQAQQSQGGQQPQQGGQQQAGQQGGQGSQQQMPSQFINQAKALQQEIRKLNNPQVFYNNFIKDIRRVDPTGNFMRQMSAKSTKTNPNLLTKEFTAFSKTLQSAKNYADLKNIESTAMSGALGQQLSNLGIDTTKLTNQRSSTNQKITTYQNSLNDQIAQIAPQLADEKTQRKNMRIQGVIGQQDPRKLAKSLAQNQAAIQAEIPELNNVLGKFGIFDATVLPDYNKNLVALEALTQDPNKKQEFYTGKINQFVGQLLSNPADPKTQKFLSDNVAGWKPKIKQVVTSLISKKVLSNSFTPDMMELIIEDPKMVVSFRQNARNDLQAATANKDQKEIANLKKLDSDLKNIQTNYQKIYALVAAASAAATYKNPEVYVKIQDQLQKDMSSIDQATQQRQQAVQQRAQQGKPQNPIVNWFTGGGNQPQQPKKPKMPWET